MKTFTAILTTGLLFGTVSSNSFAQSDTTENSQNADTTIVTKRNEIGLRLNTILLGVLGSASYPEPISLTYKRVLGNWAFRSNFTLGYWQDFETTTQIADTIKINLFTVSKNISYIGRVGFEYRQPIKRGWYLIYGADIQGQQRNENKKVQDETFRIDSISNIGTAEPIYHTTSLGTKDLLKENSITTQLGLGLSFGLMVPAGKRWLFVGQFRADTFFGPTTKTVNDYVAGTTKKYSNINTLDFTSGPALTDFSIFYRF